MENRKPVNVELLQSYAKIKRQIAELETQAEMMKPMIIEHMREVGQDSIPSAFGNFSRQVKVSYTFSDKVKDLKAKVKKQEDKEKEDGTADVRETEFLTFTPPKAF